MTPKARSDANSLARDISRKACAAAAPSLSQITRSTSCGGKLYDRLIRHVVLPGARARSLEFSITADHSIAIEGNTRDTVQATIHATGTWQPDITQFIRRQLNAGDVFLDVGANIGWFSLNAAQVVGDDGAVVAVEASPGIAERCARHAVLNDASNMLIENVAAGDTDGRIAVYRGALTNLGATSTGTPNYATAMLEGYVPVKPLAALVCGEYLSRTRIVKIDVEGAEVAVLKGLLPAIPRMREDLEIIVELSPRLLGKRFNSVEEVVGTLDEVGFVPYAFPTASYEGGSFRPQPRGRLERLRFGFEGDIDAVFSRAGSDGVLTY